MRSILSLVLLSCLVLQAQGLDSEQVDLNSNRIMSAEAYGTGNFTAEIEISEDENISKVQELGVGVYEVFQVDMNSTQRVEIKIRENQSWAEEYIKDNPSDFGGPGHIYSRGLFSLIEDEGLKHHSLRYMASEDNKTGLLKAEVTEPGIYYVVFRGTHADKSAYIAPNGECVIRYGLPGEEYRQVDNCINNGGISLIETVLYLAATIIILLIAIKGAKAVKHKLIIRKINNRVSELKQKESVSDEQVQRLYQAMEKAVDGDYREASKMMNAVSD